MKSLLSLKKVVNSTYPACHWCISPEIKLVPVSSLINLKPEQRKRYSQIWQRQGWPTNWYLCWLCKQNCELAYGKVNVWLCPGCRKCWVYLKESVDSNQDMKMSQTPAYNQLPTNCSCGWKKKHLTKREQQKIADQAIKSRLDYVKGQSYLAWCSFCSGKIIGKQKDKGIKNRNQVRFWSEKVGEERLVCNECVRGNREFLELMVEKNWGRWRVYKSKGVV